MGEIHHLVDHMKLEYKGIFSVRDMFAMFTKWYKESPYEKGGDYTSEYHTSHGKCIEHFYYPWKKQMEYMRHFMKIRILIYDLKKVNVMVNNQKRVLDHGRVIVYLDGFIEYDYENRWAGSPLFNFLRTTYFKFIYRRYTVFYEKMTVNDCHYIYDMFERFFNMYHSYKLPMRAPHFYY